MFSTIFSSVAYFDPLRNGKEQGTLPTQLLCPETYAEMKMADLIRFCQTKWMFMDSTIFENFSQIRQSKISLAELKILTSFNQILSSEISLGYLTISTIFRYYIHFWTYLFGEMFVQGVSSST